MSDSLPTANQLYQAIQDAERLARAAVQARERARTMVEGALQTPLKGGFHCDVEPCEHCCEHRSGRAPKIDTDPVLQTFIEARIDRRTFAEIAADVAAQFPPERRVGKSAIHAWWQGSRKSR